MTDELIRTLARTAGEGDLVSAERLVDVLRLTSGVRLDEDCSAFRAALHRLALRRAAAYTAVCRRNGYQSDYGEFQGRVGEAIKALADARAEYARYRPWIATAVDVARRSLSGPHPKPHEIRWEIGPSLDASVDVLEVDGFWKSAGSGRHGESFVPWLEAIAVAVLREVSAVHDRPLRVEVSFKDFDHYRWPLGRASVDESDLLADAAVPPSETKATFVLVGGARVGG